MEKKEKERPFFPPDVRENDDVRPAVSRFLAALVVYQRDDPVVPSHLTTFASPFSSS